MAEAKPATASKTVKPAAAKPVAAKVAKPAATAKPTVAAAKPAVAKKAASAAKPAATKKAAAKITVSLEQRYKMICDAAYFKAEKRGFSPENETQDWLDAEAEINKLLGM
jgi:hypothetical protein